MVLWWGGGGRTANDNDDWRFKGEQVAPLYSCHYNTEQNLGLAAGTASPAHAPLALPAETSASPDPDPQITAASPLQFPDSWYRCGFGR